MMTAQLLFIGTTELLLIGGMALLLFGGKKLPEMMRGLGQGVREFKKGVNEVGDAVKDDGAGGATPSSPENSKQAEVRSGDTPAAETGNGDKGAVANKAAAENAPTNTADGRQGN